MSTQLSASVVPESEIRALKDLTDSLPDNSALGRALAEMRDGLQRGIGVTVAREDDNLSPSQAASILGVSRTHLYKILDTGLLPYHTVGSRDRRISMADLHHFMTASMAFRSADAQSIARRQQMEDELFDEMG